MVDYNPTQLKQIQQYRAVCEGVQSSRSDTIIHPIVASQPQPVLDHIVDHYRPSSDLDLTDLTTTATDLITSYSDLVGDETGAKSPYPVTAEIINGEADPTKDKFLVELALQELAPFVIPDLETRFIAKSVVKQLDSTHERLAKAKLNRIDQQDTPSPFDNVTQTEAAYGFSEESLRNENLTSARGVGVALSALVGTIEEMGCDPEEMLPDSMLNKPIATQDGKPLGPPTSDGIRVLSEDDSETVSAEETLTAGDLADEHGEDKTNLRHQLKYYQDCVYLEHLHDRFMSFFDDPNCPKLVWKQAALDVQNGNSPLDIDTNQEEGPVTVEGSMLYDESNLPPHLAENEDSDDSSKPDQDQDKAMQSGLSQF